MATSYTVEQGDHLSAIAEKFGFQDFNTIWNFGGNSDLKKKRNPNVLLPGDILQIPDKQPKTKSGSHGKTHKFVLKRKTLSLSIVLEDNSGKPLGSTTCDVVVDGASQNKTSGGDGLIHVDIPRSAKGGTLSFKERHFKFNMGHLDPVEEPSGQVARLANLGYYRLKLDEVDEAEFASALEEFQCDFQLKVNGKCGAKTQAKLKEVHGS